MWTTDECRYATSRPGRFTAGTEPLCPLNRKFGQSQGLSRHFGGQKFVFCPYLDYNLGSPSHCTYWATLIVVMHTAQIYTYLIFPYESAAARNEQQN